MSVLPACMYVHHMYASCHSIQKIVSDPLELKLWMVMSCHVGDGQVISKCYQPLSHHSAPKRKFFVGGHFKAGFLCETVLAVLELTM